MNAAADASQLRTLDADAEARMITYIDEIKRAGNTLGGICEVVVDGLPVGLGSHVSWDRNVPSLAPRRRAAPARRWHRLGATCAR